MKQAENSLKCKALLMKITKTASFFFSFSVPFGFPRMLLIIVCACPYSSNIVFLLGLSEITVIDSSTFDFKTRRRSYFP